ncbi:MAG: tetratricopeptide repeat protein [Myxococcota bacterium]
MKRVLLFLSVAALSLPTLGCTPRIVRSAPPPAPTSAIEMAGDTERLEQVMGAGSLKRDELRRMREVYVRTLSELKERQSRDEGLQQLSIKRVELTIQLYDNLLMLTEMPIETRADRSAQSSKAYGLVREYLRALVDFEQNIELLPQTMEPPTQSDGELRVESLPPPPTPRLAAAYRAGRFEQVTREVEGSGQDILSRLPPASTAYYALSLSAQKRYEEALDASKTLASSALVQEDELELRYRQGLWLLKLGKRDEAVQLLKSLSQETVVSSKRLDEMRPRLSGTFEDLSRGSATFQQQIIEARLAMEEGRWEESRTICRQLLERETTVETVNRVENLLRQIDGGEERAFRAEYDELMTVIEVERGAAAQEAIEKLAARYPGPRFMSRLQKLREQLQERIKARDAQDAQGTTAPTRPAPVVEASPALAASPLTETPVVPTAPAPSVKMISPSTSAGASSTGNAGVSSAASASPASSGTSVAASTPPSTVPGAGLIASVGVSPAGGVGTAPAASAPSSPVSSTTSSSAGAASTTSSSAGTAPGAAAPSPVSGGVASTASSGSAGESAVSRPILTPEAQQKLLNDARAQVRNGNFEQAIQTLNQLEGTSLWAAASDERQRAIDQHIQKLRERVAREYVAAQQLSNNQEKLRKLEGLLSELKVALEKYPSTSLRGKVEQNMRVLEQELKKIQG